MLHSKDFDRTLAVENAPLRFSSPHPLRVIWWGVMSMAKYDSPAFSAWKNGASAPAAKPE